MQQEDIESNDESIDSRQERIQELLEQMDQNGRTRVGVLLQYHDQLQDVQEELEVKKQRMINEYFQVYEKMHKKALSIISGDLGDEIKKEVGQKVREVLGESDFQQFQQQKGGIKKWDGYWQKVLENCQMTSPEIAEGDKQILKFLVSIESVQQGDESKNFSVVFRFQENPFFKNLELRKDFIFDGLDEYPSRSEGTKIEWKKDYNSLIKQGQGQLHLKKKLQKKDLAEGFFYFFDATQTRDLEKIQFEEENQENEDSIDEEEKAHEQQQKHTWHYDLGQFIAFQMVPLSIEFYFGLNKEENENGLGFDQNESEEEDFNHYEDEEEEDEENQEQTGKKNPKNSNQAQEQEEDQDEPDDSQESESEDEQMKNPNQNKQNHLTKAQKRQNLQKNQKTANKNNANKTNIPKKGNDPECKQQ